MFHPCQAVSSSMYFSFFYSKNFLDKKTPRLYDEGNRYLFTAGVPEKAEITLRTCPGNSDEGKRIRSFKRMKSAPAYAGIFISNKNEL